MALLPDISIGAIEGSDPQKQIESLIKQLNECFRVLSNEDRARVRKDDSATNRLLDGFQEGGFENGDVGFKMSQTGVDVLEATSDQLIFSTDFNLPKIVDTGTTSIDATAASAGVPIIVEVEHDLGYIPIAQVFWNNSGQHTPLPAPRGTAASGGNVVINNLLSFYTDATTLSIEFMPGSTNNFGTMDFKYYLFRETAA